MKNLESERQEQLSLPTEREKRSFLGFTPEFNWKYKLCLGGWAVLVIVYSLMYPAIRKALFSLPLDYYSSYPILMKAEEFLKSSETEAVLGNKRQYLFLSSESSEYQDEYSEGVLLYSIRGEEKKVRIYWKAIPLPIEKTVLSGENFSWSIHSINAPGINRESFLRESMRSCTILKAAVIEGDKTNVFYQLEEMSK